VTSDPPLPVQRVCPWLLRDLFNGLNYDERVRHGELVLRIARRPAPAKANQPPGTMSTMRKYCDAQGRVFAIAHAYERPDGTFGGSGRPDPKWVRHGDVGLVPSHGDRETCPSCIARPRPAPGAETAPP
jgi:hypothetical protein